jgi:hypothetical protein
MTALLIDGQWQHGSSVSALSFMKAIHRLTSRSSFFARIMSGRM